MKITLELTRELEMKARESAARHDTEAVRSLLAEAFTPTVEALLQHMHATHVTHILTFNTADFARYATVGIVPVDPATV